MRVRENGYGKNLERDGLREKKSEYGKTGTGIVRDGKRVYGYFWRRETGTGTGTGKFEKVATLLVSVDKLCNLHPLAYQ